MSNIAKLPVERDREIGKAIRHFRVLRGRSQTELAVAIGVTFQQIQKYERGMNRVTIVRLEKIARSLDIGIADLLGNSFQNDASRLSSQAIDLGKIYDELDECHRAALMGLAASLRTCVDMRDAPEPRKRKV